MLLSLLITLREGLEATLLLGLLLAVLARAGDTQAVSYTHLTLPTNREV